MQSTFCHYARMWERVGLQHTRGRCSRSTSNSRHCTSTLRTDSLNSCVCTMHDVNRRSNVCQWAQREDRCAAWRIALHSCRDEYVSDDDDVSCSGLRWGASVSSIAFHPCVGGAREAIPSSSVAFDGFFQ
jgi:hypothetical protein